MGKIKEVTVTICADSYLPGGRWGYVQESNNMYGEILESVAKEGGDIKEVNNGAIVQVDEKELEDAISRVDKGLLNQRRKKRHQIEQKRFLKFLEGAVTKGNEYGVKEKGGVIYHIGLYSNTERPTIRLNGVNYPNYCMTVEEVVAELVRGAKYRDIYIKMDKGFKNIKRVKPRDTEEILWNMEIADTGNGVFMCVKVKERV